MENSSHSLRTTVIEKRNAFSGARRGSSEDMSVRQSRCIITGIIQNFFKNVKRFTECFNPWALSCRVESSNLVTYASTITSQPYLTPAKSSPLYCNSLRQIDSPPKPINNSNSRNSLNPILNRSMIFPPTLKSYDRYLQKHIIIFSKLFLDNFPYILFIPSSERVY